MHILFTMIVTMSTLDKNQVNCLDELPKPVKVGFDEYYLKNRTLLLDLKIILPTRIDA